MSNRVKVSAVSYLNTVPFIFGLRNSDIQDLIDLTLDVPSECTRKLINDEVELALVPIATMLNGQSFNIISDYCISAVNKVRTVVLLSNSPLQEIESIALDGHSLTSNILVKILAKNHWKKDIHWLSETDSTTHHISKQEGMVAIGDKVFFLESRFTYSYDLAHEWKAMTGLPMVFAVWASKRNLDKDFLNAFNQGLKYGIDNIPKLLESWNNQFLPKQQAHRYFTENISYTLDSQKIEAISLFISLSREIINN